VLGKHPWHRAEQDIQTLALFLPADEEHAWILRCQARLSEGQLVERDAWWDHLEATLIPAGA
jgi:hypothetical protein